jgi:RNA polymerase sigma-70 factor, ECF subfamily
MEDEAVVRGAMGGDQAAFAHLVDLYKTPVYNLTYRMLGNAEDAEDAAQETFLRGYAQFSTYDLSRKFSSWLMSIAAHYCIDQLRRRRFSWLPIDALDGLDWLWASNDQPEQTVIDGEDRDEVRRLLLRLPAKYRLVLVLRYWYDMSYAEISQITRMSEAAVKTRLHRAREMLSEHLNETGLPAASGENGEPTVCPPTTATGGRGPIAALSRAREA